MKSATSDLYSVNLFESPEEELRKLRISLLKLKNIEDFPVKEITEVDKWDGTNEYYFMIKYGVNGETYRILIDTEKVNGKFKLRVSYRGEHEKYSRKVRELLEGEGIEFEGTIKFRGRWI